MPRRLTAVALLFGRPRRLAAAVLAGLVLLLAAPLIAQPAPVLLVPGAAVSTDAAADIRRGADLTVQVFRETFNLVLVRQIRVVLVTGNGPYIEALLAEFKYPLAEAVRIAGATDAWTEGLIIVVNMEALKSTADRVFLIAHELTHKFQGQLAGNVDDGLLWMDEGSANSMAARVIEVGGFVTVDAGRQVWLDALREAKARPELNELRTPEQWAAALDRYTSDVTYNVATVAVLLLVDQSGYPPLISYYRALGAAGNARTAFAQTFGRSLERFEEEYRAYLGRQLGGAAVGLRYVWRFVPAVSAFVY